MNGLTIKTVPCQVAQPVDGVVRHRPGENGLDRELRPRRKVREELDDLGRAEGDTDGGEGEVAEEGGVEG